ncbi:sperm-associated microtubule inner protein 10 [Pelobates fuscus]|uniref:sperm-associated microtubule inner protein 10 n=1 Tax=Pelobates fuscus TaxID=191477 RepID=UPI002FE4CD44
MNGHMDKAQSSKTDHRYVCKEPRKTTQVHGTLKTVGTITDINGLSHSHLAEFSRKHPLFPKHYVMPWKQDMTNRKLILKHARMAGVYTGACEDSLFVENKERLCHGEERKKIMEKVKIPAENWRTNVPLHSPLSRYISYMVTQKTRLLEQ